MVYVITEWGGVHADFSWSALTDFSIGSGPGSMLDLMQWMLLVVEGYNHEEVTVVWSSSSGIMTPLHSTPHRVAAQPELIVCSRKTLV